MQKYAKNFVANTDGSTMPIFVLSLMAITALVGATLALGMDSRAAGNLQATADSAALSGATAFINVSSPRAEDRLQEAHRLAKEIAESNSDYVLKTLNVDAVVDDPYGQHTTIDIEMSFEPANAMAKVAGRNANVEITRRATADATWGFPLCILALKENDTALLTNDDIALTAENCVIWSNSDASDSMDFNGGDVKTKHLCTAGKAAVSGAYLSPMPTENCEAIPDPLKDWVPPAAGKKTKTDLEFSKRGSVQNLITLVENVYLLDFEQEAFLKDSKELYAGTFGGLYISTDGSVEVGVGGLLAAGAQIGGGGAPVTVEPDSWFHPHFDFTESQNRVLGADGKFVRGAGVGLRVDEVAQLAGLVDNIDPEIYANDVYVDSPTDTLKPGTYAGLDIHTGHVKMEPGIYHIIDAPLYVRRRATLTGEGVTIILHGEDAVLGVLDEARLTLTAPTDGDTAGFALAENRYESLKSSNPQRTRLTGSGTVNAIGAIYLPRQKISISGSGAADQTSPLLQIVADTVEMENEGALKIVFDTSKTDVPAAIKPERTARLIN